MIDLIYPVSTAPLLKGCVFDKAAEMLPVVDETGLVYAQAPRTVLHSGFSPKSFYTPGMGLGVVPRTEQPIHPVVHLLIVDRDANVLLQRRAKSKDTCPGCWDSSAGGHVVYGEYIDEALCREAQEELGLCGFNPICIDSYVFKTEKEYELVNCFAAIGSFDIHPNGDEISEVCNWTLPKIERALGKGKFTPSFEFEFRRVCKKIPALL